MSAFGGKADIEGPTPALFGWIFGFRVLHSGAGHFRNRLVWPHEARTMLRKDPFARCGYRMFAALRLPAMPPASGGINQVDKQMVPVDFNSSFSV